MPFLRYSGIELGLVTILSLHCSPKSDNEATDSASSLGSDEASLGAPTTGELPQFCDLATVVEESAFPFLIADAICKRRTECGCVGLDDTECHSIAVEYLENVRDFASEYGLHFNGDCISQRLQEFAGTGCNRSGFDSFLKRRSCGDCYFYTGSTQTEAHCTAPKYPVFNECASAEETCKLTQDICISSVDTEGNCGGLKDCGVGLACNDQGVCQTAGLGEPCVASVFDEGCALGLWCDGGTCREPKSVDSPCFRHVECEAARCEIGFCRDYAFACEFNVTMF